MPPEVRDSSSRAGGGAQDSDSTNDRQPRTAQRMTAIEQDSWPTLPEKQRGSIPVSSGMVDTAAAYRRVPSIVHRSKATPMGRHASSGQSIRAIRNSERVDRHETRVSRGAADHWLRQAPAGNDLDSDTQPAAHELANHRPLPVLCLRPKNRYPRAVPTTRTSQYDLFPATTPFLSALRACVVPDSKARLNAMYDTDKGKTTGE